MQLYRCTKLHLTITKEHCKGLRSRGGMTTSGTLPRPPQCDGCTEWMQWGDNNTVELKPTKQEQAMPTKTKQRCEGCGEVKTLLSKTLCHKCFKAKEKSAKPPVRPEEPTIAPVTEKESGEDLRLDFGNDADLLEALKAQAHKNYRSLPYEIFAILRASTGVERH